MTTTPRHVAVRVLGPIAILVAIVLPTALLAHRLPDPVAIHWSVGGAPDGHGSWWAGTVLLGVLWLVGWAVLTSSRSSQPRWITAITYGLGALLVVAQSLTLWANLDRASWQDARHLPNILPPLLGVLVASAAGGALGWLLAGPDPVRSAPAADRPRATIGLGPHETAVWSGTAHNHWLLALAPVAVLVALLIPDRIALVAISALGVMLLLLAHVRVTADQGGVTVRFGLLGWPRRHIALRDIDTAQAVDLRPLDYGGWGWRRRPGRSAVILRAGDALSLELRSGLTFVVTVDGADRAAGLVNDYLARQPVAH